MRASRKRAGERRVRAHSIIIEDSGHVSDEELPAEIRGPSLQELREWREFDLELQKKIERGEFHVDPKTGEVRHRWRK